MARVTPRLSIARGLWLCAFLVSLVGCSSSDLPLAPATADAPDALPAGAPDQAVGTPAATGTVRFAVSPPGLAKRAWGARDAWSDNQTVTRFIRARWGGVLALRNGSTTVTFYVPPGSLKQDATLSMSVSGQGLDTVIEFGPSGTEFQPPARLFLTFPADGVDPRAIVSTLSNGSDSAPVDQTVTVRGNAVMILAAIPHFSIYDPDLIEGEVIPPDDPPDDPDGDGTW